MAPSSAALGAFHFIFMKYQDKNMIFYTPNPSLFEFLITKLNSSGSLRGMLTSKPKFSCSVLVAHLFLGCRYTDARHSAVLILDRVENFTITDFTRECAMLLPLHPLIRLSFIPPMSPSKGAVEPPAYHGSCFPLMSECCAANLINSSFRVNTGPNMH
jgi:hypothetical protein